MNSRVCVDAEDELQRGEGGGGEESREGFNDLEAQPPVARDSQRGNVVLVLPPKDNLMAHSSTSNDCIPIMMNDVPVFISHTSSGSPLYIRQYPPTVEEIMGRSPEDLIANFDGFSEASGQTFEGFSEASCSSMLFEGFSEEAHDDAKITVIQSHGRISSEGVEGTQANDRDDYNYEVPSKGQTQKKSEVMGSRESASHKRKRTHEKDSSDKKQARSSTTPSPKKRVKQEEVVMKTEKSRCETSKNVHSRRRLSIEKQESESDTTLVELMGKKPRNLPSPDAPDFIGEYCNAVGCTVSFLERMAIKDVKINNGVVKELTDFASRISWEKEYVVRWIQRMSGLKTEEPLEVEDWKSIQAVLKRRKAISTIHSGNQYLKSKLKSFDRIEYVLPSVAKQQQKLEKSEMIYGTDKVVAHKTKKGQIADKEEKEQVGTRRGVKRLSDPKENENESDVNGKRISGGATMVEENTANKMKMELSSEVGERETVSRTGRETIRDQRNRRAKIKEEEKQFPQNEERHAIPEETNSQTKTERRTSSRRASLLALMEKEKEVIKQETTNEVSEESNMSRSSRRKSIVLKHDIKKQVNNKMEENKATDKNKTKVCEQEGAKREDEHADQTENETVSGRRISSRRASMLKAKEEKEREATEKDETKQTMEKTERTRNNNQRHRRESGNMIRTKEHKRQESEQQATDKNESLQDCKTQVRLDTDNESKKKKGSDRRGESEATEKHNPTKNNKTVLEATLGRKISTRRDRVLAKQKNEKQVTDMSEATQTADRTREGKINKSFRSRRASLIIKQEEVKQDTGEEKENEATVTEKEKATASKPEKGASKDGRSSRRGSLLISRQEEGKKTTKGEIEKGVSNKKTSVRNEKETKRCKMQEVADKNTNASTEKEKQTNVKEETKTEQEESQSGKEQNVEENLAPILTERGEDEIKKTEELKVIGNEEGISEENQFILRRNKVIIRDKRITRWQNKKMAQCEENKTSNKEEPSTKKDLTGSDELQEHEESQQYTSQGNVHGDSNIVSDDESDGNLVIDESDDMIHIDEGNSSMLSNPSDDMSRENRSHSESEGVPLCDRKGKLSEMVNPKIESPTEESLTRQITSFPRDKTKRLRKEEGRVKGVVGKADASKFSVSTDGEDLESKEPTPQIPTSGNTEATSMPLGTESAYAGTLGVSKSGRLRKASAKGIQSIEIKCLFMQRNGEAPRPPPPLPTSKDDQKDKDWMQDKRSPVKREPRDKDWIQDKRSPVKRESRDKDWMQDKKSPVKREHKGNKSLPNKMTLVTKEKGPTFNKTDNEFLTYTYREGHLVPKFRETDYYLGDYCAQAGLTVDDLNSDKGKKVTMTFGMIKELHDFYVSRKATKTALAIRLFKMQEKKLLDNTHLLSTVMRITNVAKMKYSKNVTFDREFTLPIRLTSLKQPEEDEEKARKTQNLQNSKASSKSPPGCVSFPNRVRRSPKKRSVKPEDSGDEYDYFGGMEEEDSVYNDILLTCGQLGVITRGDIMYLYSKWLRSKMSQGSNTFVTDLLRSVEQLMAERQVAPLRIPAGTLMSSSVKLHDEYKQILRISKEDAIIYLQEDWLEDIKYLLSISGPSRRNTSEGEAVPGGTIEVDTSTVLEKHSKTRTPRQCSGGYKEEDTGDFEGEPISNTLPFKGTVKEGGSRSHQMESVGKRLGKRRSIRESLNKFEKEILLELEKEGVLEEEEEDILQQLDLEKQIYEDQLQEEEKREKKKKRAKKNLEEKYSGKDKDMQKEVTPVQKGIKPVDDGDLDCEVQKIVDYQEIHDSRGKHFRYLVRWVGFGPQDDSWVDEANLQCPEILQAFWKRKSMRQDKSEPLVKEKYRPKRETGPVEPECLVTESKDEEESIIQVMVKHGSAQDTACTNNTPMVTKRELLSLYDGWRQENQDELMAGGSNTVNVEVFKNRVRDLMASRGIKFYPESLLNACFMMTLMKTRLQSRMAINKFLDTSCLEVLESSQKQYLKRKYSQIGEVLSHSHMKEQKPSVLSLQNELHSLKLDLTTAHKWRAVKNSHLGGMEEEVDCLETAVAMPDDKKTETVLYLKQELHKLKCDLKGLERNHIPDANDKAAKTVQVPLFSYVRYDSEGYKTNSKIVRDKLLNMSITKSTVNTIMNIVARRVGGQCVQE